MAKLLYRPSAKRLEELDVREVADADVVVIDRNLVAKDRGGPTRRAAPDELRDLLGGERQKLQEEIPAWAEPVWAAECERLAQVGLVPLRPGVKQVTLILLPHQRELKTPTSVDRVDELMRGQRWDWIEVESLDYADQVVRIRRADVVGWMAVVYDDSIPEQRPQQVGAMPPGSPAFDLSRVPSRRGKG